MVSLLGRLASLGRHTSAHVSSRRSSKLSSYLSSDSYLSPRHLFVQILLLQAIYYGIGFVLILFTCLVSGRPPFSYKLIFSWVPVRADTTLGWTLFILWLLDTFFSVVALTVVVGRSKLALDFTLTLHGIHFMICWITSGLFPTSGLWWALMLVSIILMVTLGTYTSQWRELRVTFFDGSLEGAHSSQPKIRSADSATGSIDMGSAVPHTPAEEALLSQYNEFELQDFDNENTSEADEEDLKEERVNSKGKLILGSNVAQNKGTGPSPTANQSSNKSEVDTKDEDSLPGKGSKGSRISVQQEMDLRNDQEDEDDGDLSSLIKK